jgi:NAD(P)-dependent dehydrogenase (short-subunit alcohol dehydrogenase family)
MRDQFHCDISLVAGNLADPEVLETYLAAIEKSGSPFAGAAIFPGDPARVTFDDLNRETLNASLESNYVGPLLLAKALGEAMERGENSGSIVLLSTMQAIGVFPSSLNYAAPKAALIQAAKILAQHWNRVRVNVVAPGATIAGMAAPAFRLESTIVMSPIKRWNGSDARRMWGVPCGFSWNRITTLPDKC